MSEKIYPIRLERAIKTLNLYMDDPQKEAVVEAMQALKEAPESQSHFEALKEAYNNLEGIAQGTVLTYAPYLAVIFSDSPFDNPKSDDY